MASSSSMSAVVFREFGGPQLMRLEEVPMPVPSSGEVLLEVEAVAVDLCIMNAAVAFDFTERPRPRQQIIADAADAANLIEVAVVVGGLFSTVFDQQPTVSCQK
jgi:hypothetical protein